LHALAMSFMGETTWKRVFSDSVNLEGVAIQMTTEKWGKKEA